MTNREYFKISKKTIFRLFKQIAAITTAIIAALFILTSFRFGSFMDVVYLFLTCFVLGQLIAFSLTVAYFSLNYRPVKDQLDLYDRFSDDFIDEFKVELIVQPITYRYSLPEIKMFCSFENRLFGLMPDRAEKKIFIYIYNNMEGIDYFRAAKYVDKEYKNDSITLGGAGFVRVVKVKNWKHLTSIDFKQNFRDLLAVSEKEGLGVAIHNSSEEDS